jgi:hypothetical protein
VSKLAQFSYPAQDVPTLTLRVDSVSAKAVSSGLMVAMIVVFELPPRESCRHNHTRQHGEARFGECYAVVP